MDERRIEFGRVILRAPRAAHLMARPPIRVIEAIERTFEKPEPADALWPSIETILTVVAEVHGVTVTALKSERRVRVLTRARQEAMWLARDLTLHSSGTIGRVIGKRDHTTILHGIARGRGAPPRRPRSLRPPRDDGRARLRACRSEGAGMRRGRVVFDRWLMGFRRRIWVGRVVRATARGRETTGASAIWSTAETLLIAAEMGREG